MRAALLQTIVTVPVTNFAMLQAPEELTAY
jgi:hypothetical protein